MIERTLEPEVMDEPQRAAAYAKADFSQVNDDFVAGLLRRCPEAAKSRVLDIGCGPADIPIRLLRKAPAAEISAVDASGVMIALAVDALAAQKLTGKIRLLVARVPGLPLESGSFDAVISNSLTHHLPDPNALWGEAKRLLKPGGFLYVTDLIRAESKERARETVETYSGNEHPLLKDDFYHSLLAAFTVEEVSRQLISADLGELEAQAVSDRHWLVAGTVA